MVIRALSSLRAPTPVARWVAEKSRGERRILAGVLMVAAMALFWAAIWQPLVRDTVALRAAQNGNAAALAAARRMTEEIAGLARPLESAVAADARGDLERVLAQQNLRSAVTQLEWREGRARVVFAAVGYEPLIVALEALQQGAQLRVVEATLTARVEPGMVRAELTLAR
jgi:type II secretory pathway component PulM